MDDEDQPPQPEDETQTGGQAQSQVVGGPAAPVGMAMGRGRDATTLRALRSVTVIGRLACVLVGFVAILLPCIAWGNADLFTEVTRRILVCPYDNTGTFVPSAENCTVRNLTRAENCVNRNNRYKAADKETKACPTKWLVIPSVYIVGLGWLIIVTLFILLCLDLIKNNAVLIVDLIGHIAAGILMFLGGIVMFAYFLVVLVAQTCSDENAADEYDRKNQEDRELDFWRRFGPGAPPEPSTTPGSATNSTGTSTVASMARAQRTKAAYEFINNECPVLERQVYHHWHVFGGAIAAFATSGLLILIIVLSARRAIIRPMY